MFCVNILQKEEICANYNFIDRTGERYGKLTVLERANDYICKSGKLVQWKCRCDCGREKIIIGSNLKKVTSCGQCQHACRSLQDLTGKRFGKLVVVARADNYILPCGQKQTMWTCKCDCGSIVTVRGTHLKDGFTRSCGCIKSFYEEQIAEYLTEKNISFTKGYSFPDCINSKQNILFFDFALFQNEMLQCLIEFQGEQHYIINTYFGKMQREETDAIKKEYCLTHSILLYEIRYDENIIQSLDNILQTLHDNTVPSSDNSEKV